MTVRQAFFNGDRLDATASLLLKEPGKRDIVSLAREKDFVIYRFAIDVKFNALDHAHEARTHSNDRLHAFFDGEAKAAEVIIRKMEHEIPWLKEARR